MSDSIWTDMVRGAGQGAAVGSIVPGVGTAIGAAAGGLLGVALNVAPGVSQWLGGSADVAAKAAAAVQTITGKSDPADAQAALAADQGMTGDLHVQLVQIATDARAEENRSAEARQAAMLADVANARAQTLALAQAGSKISWSAPVISVIVLLSFGTAMVLTILRAVPDASMPVLNVLLGSLTAMATSVVSYWVGSSAGSAAKDGRIAQMVPANLLPKPAAIVPAADARHP